MEMELSENLNKKNSSVAIMSIRSEITGSENYNFTERSWHEAS